MPKINLNELKKGAGFLLVGQVVQAASGFGVNLVLVRYLMPQEFGRFVLVMAAMALIYSVLSLRVESMIIRATEDGLNEETRERYFSASVIETVFSSSVMILWIYWSANAGLWEVGLIIALGVRHWANQNKAFFERSMPYRKLAFMETITLTAGHLLALALILSGFGAAVLYIREFFLTVAGLVGLWAIGGLTFCRFVLPGWGDVCSLFKEARGMWLDAVLENSFNRIIILAVGLIGGDRAAGFFFQAQRLAHVPQQFLGPVVSRVAGNWFGRTENRLERRNGRDKLLMVLAPPLLISALACFFLADPIVPWLFGERWAPSAPLFAAMCGMAGFLSLFEVLKSYCWTARQVRWLLVGRIAQYGGCLALVGAALIGYLPADLALAAGLSAAYALAVIVVIIALRRAERDW